MEDAMVVIRAPKLDGTYAERERDLESTIEGSMQDLIDEANGAGWGTLEVLVAINSISVNLQKAYLGDPDPIDDDLSLPAVDISQS